MYINRGLTILSLIVAIFGTGSFLILQAHADQPIIFEGGNILQECNWTGCFEPSIEGVGATLQVNAETLSGQTNESISEWISIDSYTGLSSNPVHQWAQIGWGIGYLPNGFNPTPILYAESQLGTEYNFVDLTPASFGSSYNLEVHISANQWVFLIGGVVMSQASIPSTCSCQLMYSGQASAALEIHEPSTTTSPNTSGNGLWSNLQYYVTQSTCYGGGSSEWLSWGSGDPTDCWSNTTQDVYFSNSCFMAVGDYSVTSFVAGVAGACNRGGGGGGMHQA